MNPLEERSAAVDYLEGEPLDNGARETCDSCGEAYAIGDWPFCPHRRVRSGYSTPFLEFTHDLGTSQVHVDSLHTLRRLERQSEKRAGEAVARHAETGSAPKPEERQLVFREFSQDKSNRTEGVFGKREQVRPTTRGKNGIPFVTGGGIVTSSDLD